MRVPPSSSDRSLQLYHYTYLQKGFLAVSLPLHSFYQAPGVPLAHPMEHWDNFGNEISS